MSGLTAAIYARRANKKTLVIEKLTYGGQIINAPSIENYPAVPNANGVELATTVYNQAKQLGAEIIFENVVEIQDSKTYKKVLTNKNEYKTNYKNEYKADYAATTEAAAEGEERPRHPRVEIDPDKATSIFISIGKNRRVYPRDLVGLLVAVGGIDRERIGDIKVLANYSFVQLYTEDCQTAIDKLNGYDYRGRKLAVSFSRQKGDADAAEASIDASEEGYSQAAEEAAVEQSAVEAAPEMSAEDAAAYAAAEKAAADKEPFGNV